MDEHLHQATAEFITERVNHHGQNEPDAVTEAYAELRASACRLRATLDKERALLLRDCEDAYRYVDGETMRFFYTAGFGDAIGFLMGWGKER